MSKRTRALRVRAFNLSFGQLLLLLVFFVCMCECHLSLKLQFTKSHLVRMLVTAAVVVVYGDWSPFWKCWKDGFYSISIWNYFIISHLSHCSHCLFTKAFSEFCMHTHKQKKPHLARHSLCCCVCEWMHIYTMRMEKIENTEAVLLISLLFSTAANVKLLFA